VSVHEVKPVQLSTAVRRVWQQFSRLTLLYIVASCVGDVANVDCALCRQLNKRTLLLLLLLLLQIWL